MLLFALGVAIALFLISNFLLDKYIDVKYLSEEKVTERTNDFSNDLQSYVTARGLSCEDIDKISDWAGEHKYLHVLIYKGEKLLFESGKYEDGKASGIVENKENADDSTEKTVKKYKYTITASDGNLTAYIADYSENLYYEVFDVVSVVIGFLGFVLVMWVYFFDISKRITRLAREVTAIADGDMTRTITADGEDEITRLCIDVEYMRNSMLENIAKEHDAMETNRELITAMSHDIRTPLTVLLGYMDIMKLNAPDGDMQQYIEASERTALRLKQMSDDMFGYFLVYGGGIEVDIQECDARTIIDQMLSGHVFLLREQGYTIDFNFENEGNDFLSEVIVVTDPPQLMRIVENLFSNLMKYADKDKPIKIFVDAEIDELNIRMENYVRKNPDEAQKNGIGLRSCMKLANAMDVRFSSKGENGVFTSKLFVPIIPIVDNTEPAEDDTRGGFTKWLKSIFEKFKSFSAKTWEKFKDFVTRKE